MKPLISSLCSSGIYAETAEKVIHSFFSNLEEKL